MSENQQVIGGEDNTHDSTHNRANSIILNVSFDNRKSKHPHHVENISFYKRLHKYAVHKGISDQAVIRFAVSTLLDKVGY